MTAIHLRGVEAEEVVVKYLQPPVFAKTTGKPLTDCRTLLARHKLVQRLALLQNEIFEGEEDKLDK